jgi:hypothetical protein
MVTGRDGYACALATGDNSIRALAPTPKCSSRLRDIFMSAPTRGIEPNSSDAAFQIRDFGTVPFVTSLEVSLNHFLGVEKQLIFAPNVSTWPDPEVPVDGKRVRLLGQTGKHLLGLRITGHAPYRPLALPIAALRKAHSALTLPVSWACL